MRRTILVAGSVAAVILLLAGAAFVGARMLTVSKEEVRGFRGERVMELVVNDGSGPVSLRIKVEPAPELPDRPSEAGGVFVRREDNSIFVGTGNIELDVEVNGNTGERSLTLGHDGPEVEVVVTRDTTIYQDVTDMSPGDPSSWKSGEKIIQQEIKLAGSVEEIGGNTELQAWGERRGDRVVAEVLVYRIVEG